MKTILAKVSRLHVLIGGLVIVVALAVGGGILLIRPKQQELAKTRSDRMAAEEYAARGPAKLQELERAKAEKAAVKVQLARFRRKMPSISMKDPKLAMIAMWYEYRDNMGPKIKRFVDSTGNQLNSLSVPAPQVTPPDPSTSYIAVSLSNFAITARNFRRLLLFFRKVPQMPRIATIANITVNGPSPNLQVSAPMTVHILTKDYTPPAPAAAAPGGAEGGPPGGPPGGAPPPAPGGEEEELEAGEARLGTGWARHGSVKFPP